MAVILVTNDYVAATPKSFYEYDLGLTERRGAGARGPGGRHGGIGLESATSQHSNNFKNSKIGSTWIQFLYGSKHISSRLTLSKVM